MKPVEKIEWTPRAAMFNDTDDVVDICTLSDVELEELEASYVGILVSEDVKLSEMKFLESMEYAIVHHVSGKYIVSTKNAGFAKYAARFPNPSRWILDLERSLRVKKMA